MIGHRSIDDLLGEALRRHRHGLIRPLWADMPEGGEKQSWREMGRVLIDFMGAREGVARRAEEIERDAAERRESIRKGARRAPKVFKVESGDGDRVSTCADEEESELTGELARLRSEVERLTSERDQAQGLLREAAAETLSTRTAAAALREAWRASAERAAIFATDDPQTPEQWRAFGGVEATRACADELDPEKADSFEPCELAKARTAIATMREALISASEFIAEELDNRDSAGGDESDYVNDAKCTLALVSDAITLSQNVFPASPISEPRS